MTIELLFAHIGISSNIWFIIKAVRIIFLILTVLLTPFWVSYAFAGDPPTPISPANNSTVASSKVEWQSPSYELYSSNPYRVQVDDDSSFGSPNKDYYTANTAYTPQLSNGTWYWRVKVRDTAGTWSNWSGIWSFILDTTSTPIASASPIPSPTSSPTPTLTPSSTTSTTSGSSSFTISNVPSSVNSTEEFRVSVNLSIPKNPNTTFYLKGAFKKKDSSNYFGLTKVGDSWVKNNTRYEDQYKITTNGNGSWSGNLEVQPDILDSGYEGAGEYIFKVGRYTENGSLTWSNEVIIKINAQEVILGAGDSGVNQVETKPKDLPKPSKTESEKYSLEKYVQVATPSSQSTPSPNPKAEVKGRRQINFLSILGSILVIIGAVPITYAIYNIFRKRNEKVG